MNTLPLHICYYALALYLGWLLSMKDHEDNKNDSFLSTFVFIAISWIPALFVGGILPLISVWPSLTITYVILLCGVVIAINRRYEKKSTRDEVFLIILLLNLITITGVA